MPATKITKSGLSRLGVGVWWDEEMSGFAVQVYKTGGASFLVRYRLAGERKQRQAVLGSERQLGVAEAREKARVFINAAKDGRDLKIEARDRAAELTRRSTEEAKRITSAEAVERFMAWFERTPSRRGGQLPAASSIAATKLWLSRFGNMHGAKKLADVTRADVEAVLHATPLLSRRNSYGAIGRMIRWAVSAGHVDQDVTTLITPPSRGKARDNTPKPQEVRAIMDAADELVAEGDWPAVLRDFVWLLALTAQRRSEVASLQWQDVDFDTGVWAQPPVNKSRRPHKVPLGPMAAKVLRDRWETQGKPKKGIVLRGTRGGDRVDRNNLMGDLRERTGIAFVFHDFRRSAVSAMAEHGVDFATADALLNHAASASKGGLTAVYQRAELMGSKRRAVELWEAQLAGKTTVVPFKRPV